MGTHVRGRCVAELLVIDERRGPTVARSQIPGEILVPGADG